MTKASPDRIARRLAGAPVMLDVYKSLAGVYELGVESGKKQAADISNGYDVPVQAQLTLINHLVGRIYGIASAGRGDLLADQMTIMIAQLDKALKLFDEMSEAFNTALGVKPLEDSSRTEITTIRDAAERCASGDCAALEELIRRTDEGEADIIALRKNRRPGPVGTDEAVKLRLDYLVDQALADNAAFTASQVVIRIRHALRDSADDIDMEVITLIDGYEKPDALIRKCLSWIKVKNTRSD